jgi:ketosteroid isomerase-like protein
MNDPNSLSSMPANDPVDTVRRFWALMASNRFDTVCSVLAPGFVLEWPQTRERIRGPEQFARMNQAYPSHGPWRFTVHRLFGDTSQVVSDVSVTDGVQSARAISFFTVAEGQIERMVEYWPEPYTAPAGRAHLVEPMD